MLSGIAKAIGDRLEGDSGSGGLFQSGGTNEVSGVFYEQTPPGSQAPDFPFIVFDITTEGPEHGYRKYSFSYLVDVHLFSRTTDGRAVAETRINRIIGNRGLPPSYGLHLWQPSIQGLDTSIMEHIGRTDNDTRDIYDTVLQFRVYSSEDITES